jgi:hypothetical protein
VNEHYLPPYLLTAAVRGELFHAWHRAGITAGLCFILELLTMEEAAVKLML